MSTIVLSHSTLLALNAVQRVFELVAARVEFKDCTFRVGEWISIPNEYVQRCVVRLSGHFFFEGDTRLSFGFGAVIMIQRPLNGNRDLVRLEYTAHHVVTVDQPGEKYRVVFQNHKALKVAEWEENINDDNAWTYSAEYMKPEPLLEGVNIFS